MSNLSKITFMEQLGTDNRKNTTLLNVSDTTGENSSDTREYVNEDGGTQVQTLLEIILGKRYNNPQ